VILVKLLFSLCARLLLLALSLSSSRGSRSSGTSLLNGNVAERVLVAQSLSSCLALSLLTASLSLLPWRIRVTIWRHPITRRVNIRTVLRTRDELSNSNLLLRGVEGWLLLGREPGKLLENLAILSSQPRLDINVSLELINALAAMPVEHIKNAICTRHLRLHRPLGSGCCLNHEALITKIKDRHFLYGLNTPTLNGI
jgi:hypothetical protein